MSVSIMVGDCRERMKELADNSVDSVVCDPPYGLEFMGKDWDSFKTGRAAKYAKGGEINPENIASRSGKGGAGPSYVNRPAKRCANCGKQSWSGSPCVCPEPRWVMDNSPLKAFQDWSETWAREVYRVLKPGGHLVAFSGTRTYHRMAVAIEDAGFEIRDQLAWIYGSGFPKSLDVSKQLDKMAGAEREVVSTVKRRDIRNGQGRGYGEGIQKAQRGDGPVEYLDHAITAPATQAAQQWQGWGTALKPSWETIALAQKPYDFRQLCGILARNISEAVCQLPSLAKDAEPSSWLSQSVFVEGFGSAQWSAVAECNTPDALFDLMATLPSASALPLSLSTAFSWLNTLAAVSTLGSTFTTETVTSLTTDLRTLKSLLSKNTPAIIVQAAIQQNGTPSAASLAASLFSAVELRLRLTQGLSALDLATLKDLESCQGADVSPNLEPICLARKPLIGSVAANVLAHGTGALNIDATRIQTGDDLNGGAYATDKNKSNNVYGKLDYDCGGYRQPLGRWPANLCHDGSDEVLAGFPAEAGGGFGVRGSDAGNTMYGGGKGLARPTTGQTVGFGDSGSAARFFATFPMGEDEWEFANSAPNASSVEIRCASCGTPTAADPAETKTSGSKSENLQPGPASIGGCNCSTLSLSPASSAVNPESTGTIPTTADCSKSNGSATAAIAPITKLENGEKAVDAKGRELATRFLYCPKATSEERGENNLHPTVKPQALMRWLCRLVTPPGGTILDPFMGSGSTLIAADAEQFNAIGCELSPEYAAIAERRIRDAAGMFADVKVAA